MAALRVPKKHHNGLARYLKLSEESSGLLMTNLENLAFTLDFGEPLRNAVTATYGIPAGDAPGIADALTSIYMAWSNSDRARPDFINEVVQAITESSSEDFVELRESKERIWSRLTRLLDIQSLTLAVKAGSFLSEFDSIFKSARVLTDVRPVFTEDGKEAQAITVVHNLRIHYHRGDKHEDFFVALDSHDLRKLMDSLTSAKDRADGLKATFANTNIPYIEPE